MLPVITLLLAAPLTASALPQLSDTIVKVVSAPLHRGVATAIEEISIGDRGRAPDYDLTSVTDIAVAENGSLLILDAPLMATPRVRLFDRAGQFIRNVGGEGRGIGQFEMPAALASMPDGRFLLYDMRFGRFNVYSVSGDPVDTWSIGPRRVLRGAPGIMSVDSAGMIALRTSFPSLEKRQLGCFKAEQSILLIRNGIVVETLNPPELPDLCIGVGKKADRGTYTQGFGIAMPYFPFATWRYSPQGFFVTAISDRYALDLLPPENEADTLPNGSPRRSILSIRMNAPPVAISVEERKDQKAHVEAQLASFAGHQEGDVLETPAYKPFFNWIYTADDGRIWVWIHAPSERHAVVKRADETVAPLQWREPTLLDVFERNGTYVGRVRVPDNLRIVRLSGDLLWGVIRDEAGNQVVKRYRAMWE